MNLRHGGVVLTHSGNLPQPHQGRPQVCLWTQPHLNTGAIQNSAGDSYCPLAQPSSEGPTPRHLGVSVPSQRVWALTHGVIGVLPGHGWETPIPSCRVWAEGAESQALFPFQDLVSKRFVTLFCRTERTFSRRTGRYCSLGAMSDVSGPREGVSPLCLSSVPPQGRGPSPAPVPVLQP